MKPKMELTTHSDRELADRVHNRNTALRGKTEYEKHLESQKKIRAEEARRRLIEAQRRFLPSSTEQKTLPLGGDSEP